MSHILAIEFCLEKFKDKTDCVDWLKTSPFSALLDIKQFRLRTNTSCRYLTTEKKRGVWRWDKGIATCDGVTWIRPEVDGTVVLGVMHGDKTPAHLFPSLLPATIKHEEEKVERARQRLAELRAKRAEENKNKPPKPKQEKKKREYKPKGPGRKTTIKPDTVDGISLTRTGVFAQS